MAKELPYKVLVRAANKIEGKAEIDNIYQLYLKLTFKKQGKQPGNYSIKPIFITNPAKVSTTK